MVKDVRADAATGAVRVDIELTTPACPSRDVIARSVEAAVRAVDGVSAVRSPVGQRERGPNRPDNRG